MEKLTYKSFVWPQNPTEYRQEYSRKVWYGESETGRDEFLGLGGRKLTILGSGTFLGEEAYTHAKQLAQLCNHPLAGSLVHPVWGEVQAFLTDLQLEEDPRQNCIRYQFTFQVADENGVIPV